MAHRLRPWWWVGAGLLACAIVGVVYVPPRASPIPWRRYAPPEPPPPYRLRVQALAWSWRATSLELHLLQYRERLRPELERQRALDLPGAALLVEWPGVADSVRDRMAAQLDAEWSDLQLGIPKISVGVVLALEPQNASGRPKEDAVESAYLLPDSTDRTTCIVYQPVSRYDLANPRGVPMPNLGACGFYAAFGSPGREIRRWLGAREFDLATWSGWGALPMNYRMDRLEQQDRSWFWWSVYRFQPDGVACLAGRAARCRSAVLHEPPAAPQPSHLVEEDRRWRSRPPALAGGSHYLSDVVRAVGRERFQRFWNSELPPDTALAEALRVPVGEWTKRWQEGFAPGIRLGAAPAAGPALLALLLALAAVAIVLRFVTRREVR